MNNKKSKQITLFTPLANENGAVLIITVIILLLLTLIGISGINTASTDIQITSNYRIHNLNLSSADAAVNRAKSLIAYASSATLTTWINNTDKDEYAWVNDVSVLYAKDDKYYKDDSTSWDDSDTTVLNTINVEAVLEDWGKNSAITPTTMPNDEDVEFVVYINKNSTEGNSVVIAKSNKNGGEAVIEAGFNTE